MGHLEDFAEWKRKKEEEEKKKLAESEAKQAAFERQSKAREGLSPYEQFQYDRILKERGEEPVYSYNLPKAEEEPEEPKTLEEKLASRGVTVEWPSAEKAENQTAAPAGTGAGVKLDFSGLGLTPSLSGSTGRGIRNTYAEEQLDKIKEQKEAGPLGIANAGPGPSPSLSSGAPERGIRNTYIADEMAKTEDERRAKMIEDAYRDATVGNEKWLSSLRPREEIEAELEAARGEKSAAEGEKTKNDLLGWIFDLTGMKHEQAVEYGYGKPNEVGETSERVRQLEDELGTRLWADYERNRYNADFAANSGYKESEKKVTGKQGVNGKPDIEYADPLHEWVNGDDNARYQLDLERDRLVEGFGGGAEDLMLERLIPTSAFEYTQTREMTADELSMYNYLYNTKGAEEATGYLRYLQSDLFARQAEREQAEAAARAKADPVGSTVETVIGAPLKGLSYVAQTANYIASGEIDENAPYNRLTYIPSAERAAVTKEIEKNWGGFGTFAYGVGVSMAEFWYTNQVASAMAPGMPGVGEALALAIMGSGAAADATVEAKKRGLSNGQAYALGTIAGLAEIATEKISIEALFDSDATGWRYLLQNTISEGSEEAGSDLINWFADIILTQDASEWQTEIEGYRRQGMTERDAVDRALIDRGLQLLLDAGSGALSGFLLASGYAAATRP